MRKFSNPTASGNYQSASDYVFVKSVAHLSIYRLPSFQWFGWYCLIAMAFLVTPANGQKSGNPIFPGYNADPDALVVGNALVVHTTGFRTHTTSDLINWTKEPNSFPTKPEDCDGCRNWAPSVSRFQERYFAFITNSVYVGDSPIGPFHFVKSEGSIGTGIDAHGFIDDDGKMYVYSGNTKLVITEFEEGLEDKPVVKNQLRYNRGEPGLEDYFEGPYMIKKNGIYYITFSSSNWRRDLYNVRYATSTSPRGPWTYGGQILKSDATHKGPGHHSIFKLPGTEEYYIVYHRYNTTETGLLYEKHPRVTCIDRLYFNPDGTIKPVVMTDAGVDKHVFPASAMKVTSMSLMDASTDKDITLKMSDGQKIDSKTLGNDLNIRANVFGLAGSVRFTLDGKNTTDNNPPYSIGGDDGAKDFNAWTPSPGEHTLKATPYTEKDAKGEAGQSLTITFVVGSGGGDAPTKPSAPTGLSASVVSDNKIDLTWNDNSDDETGFKIDRKKGSASWSQIATVGAGEKSYSDASLDDCTSYSYRVSAYNAQGNSSYSNEASSKTRNCTTQPALLKIQAEDGKISGPNVAARSRYSGFEGSGYVGWLEGASAKVSVTFTDVPAGDYALTVGYHSWTDRQADLTVNGTTTTHSWLRTDLDWRTNTFDISLAAGDHTVAVGNGYINVDYFELIPIDGSSSRSARSTSDQRLPSAVRLYPNPTIEGFALRFVEEGIANVSVHHLVTGQRLHRGRYASGQLIEIDIAQGLYLVRTTLNNRTHTHKLLVK